MDAFSNIDNTYQSNSNDELYEMATRLNNKRKKKTRKVYRKRVKFSQCRKKRASSCRQSNNCKMAMGTKRRYCRKKKNAKVRVLPKSK